MGYWNYRVMRHHDGIEPFDAIYEVYYDDEDNVTGWTQDPATAMASVELDEKLDNVLDMMRGALEKPTLDFFTGKEID